MKYEFKIELETDNEKLIEAIWDAMLGEEFDQKKDKLKQSGNKATTKFIEENLTEPIYEEE